MTSPPKDLVANPRLSSWLAVEPDGTVALRIGKVELGQGILTALVQIAADELDVSPTAVRMLPAHTGVGPDEGPTAGSMSVADAGAAVRQVCAQVRALFLEAASAALEVDVADLTVADGVVSTVDGARRLGYGELAARVDLDRDAGPLVADQALRPAPAHRDVAAADRPARQGHRRSPLPVRPRAPRSALGPGGPAAVGRRDPARGRRRRRAGVRRTSSPSSATARSSASSPPPSARRTSPRSGCAPPPSGTRRRPCPTRTTSPATCGPARTRTFAVDESGADVDVAVSLSASYSRPFLAHASISPSCGAARWDDGAVHVWSSSQSVFGLRKAICLALDLPSRRTSSSSTSRAPAPTGTTAPTTPRSTRCCWPGPCPGGRCTCGGAGPTS